MSMLARYKKAGGFSQLISLIESCDPEKQKQILELVGAEDPGWAVLVKRKALSVEKVFEWPIEVVAKVLEAMPEKIAAFACHNANRDRALEAIALLPGLKAREMRELFEEEIPTQNEKHAAAVRALRVVRDLERSGKLRIQQLDPESIIDERLIA